MGGRLLYALRAWWYRTFPPKRMLVEGRELTLVTRIRKHPVYYTPDFEDFDGLNILKCNPFASRFDYYIMGRRGYARLRELGEA